MRYCIEKLANLTSYITDGKHGDCDSQDNSGYYFISCKDIDNGFINYDNARQITKDSFIETHKRTRLEPNDILITNSGTIGRMALISAENPNISRTTFQKSVAIIKPICSVINPKYLYYNLIANKIYLVELSNGAAQKNLLLSTIREFRITYPSDIKEQERIANILSKYDELIDLNNKRIKLLEKAAEELYKEWFVRFRFPNWQNIEFDNGIPKCFEVVKAFDYINFEKGFEPGANAYLDDKSKTPFNRVGDIEKRRAQNYIDIDLFENVKQLKKEDVVITFDASVGKMGYGLEGAYSSGVCRISGKNESVLGNMLIYCIFHNPSMQAEIQSYANGATIGHAGKCIKKLKMFYNENIFKTYTEKTISIFNELINLTIENDNLSNQRDLLLPRLMSGKLEV